VDSVEKIRPGFGGFQPYMNLAPKQNTDSSNPQLNSLEKLQQVTTNLEKKGILILTRLEVSDRFYFFLFPLASKFFLY
jgi:hypothetical protein